LTEPAELDWVVRLAPLPVWNAIKVPQCTSKTLNRNEIMGTTADFTPTSSVRSGSAQCLVQNAKDADNPFVYDLQLTSLKII
jgi:hypothetical protein